MQLFLLIHFQVLQALDRDKDGFITKKEFMMMNKAMTPTQVNAICCKLFPYVISFTIRIIPIVHSERNIAQAFTYLIKCNKF